MRVAKWMIHKADWWDMKKRPLSHVTLQNRVEKISRNLVSCEHLPTAAALRSYDVTKKLANDFLTSWSDKPMIIWIFFAFAFALLLWLLVFCFCKCSFSSLSAGPCAYADILWLVLSFDLLLFKPHFFGKLLQPINLTVPSIRWCW